MDRRLLLQAALGAGAAASLVPAAQAANQPPIPKALTVELVQMPAWVDDRAGRRPLSPGDTVGTDQPLETGADAAVLLRLPEGSAVRLGEKTRLSVPQLAVEYDLGTTTVRTRMQLADGFLRFTTSAVAQAIGKREVDIVVRTATIGVRGTDFWTMTDAEHDAACLFEGRVQLDTRDQGPLVLEQPTAFWARFFDKPVQPVGHANPAELAKFLRSTEPQPGRGVAVAGGRWRTVAATESDPARAAALVKRLREAGFPAEVRSRKGGHEVRINRLATREDASAVLKKIAAIDGVNGRVALAAA
jgi:hypothetical protein